MSHDVQEFQVPIIFDVSGYDRDEAGAALTRVLSNHVLPGTEQEILDGTYRVESWWTLEGADKQHDRNDNEAGIVLFHQDLDYLLDVLIATQDNASFDLARHTRLIAYLSPHGRVGTPNHERDDDGY